MPQESPAQRLSVPIETLLGKAERPERPCHPNADLCRGSLDVENLIVGSGYGAAMAALQLASRLGSQPGIWVFERGREVVPGEFPKTLASLPKEVTLTTAKKFVGEKDALWDIRHGKGISAVVARGVGGGSLTNASVAFRPPPEVLERWPRHPEQATDAWQSRLQPSIQLVEQLLSVQSAPSPRGLAKFKALDAISRNLNAPCEPVRLSVQFEPGPVALGSNHVGVEQAGCTLCGNCISGCNVGAKGSLDMNAWPLARTLGVEIYAGVTVRSVQPNPPGSGRRWCVSARSTYDERIHFQVHADRVILAAGTFGSTEILSRSERKRGLTLSRAQLGRRFSGNGDVLTYGEGQSEPVNAVSGAPAEEGDAGLFAVGPTVVGAARVQPQAAVPGWSGALGGPPGQRQRPGFLLQDGSAPYAFRRMLEEVLVTRNLIRRFKDGRLPPWFASRGAADPAAATLEASSHHQLMLAMSDDGALGQLEAGRGGRVVGSWPEDAPSRTFFSEVRDALGAADPARDGGTPRDTSSPIRELDKIDELMVTVHPLGGCCLARCAEEGVVNLNGEVFSGTHGTDTHQGLYVLDGSIIPGALGVNPFLTIAALSHRLAGEIPLPANAGAVDLLATRVAAPWRRRPSPRTADPIPKPRDEKVKATLQERFFLRLDGQTRRQVVEILGPIPAGSPALILQVEMDVEDAFAWLEHPSTPLPATFQFFRSNTDFGDTVPSTALVPLGASHAGRVVLNSVDPVRDRFWRRLWRTSSVVGTFLINRGDELLSISGKTSLHDWYKGVRDFFRVARVHTDYRYMKYEFRSGDLAFEGLKSFVYRGWEPDPLQTLRRLPFTLTRSAGELTRSAGKPTRSAGKPTSAKQPQLKGELHVDVIRLTGEPAALQVESTPDTPTTVVALSAAILLFGRGILQSMFWSFRRPSYAKYPSKAEANLPRLGWLPDEGGGNGNGGGKGWITRSDSDGTRLGCMPATLRYRRAGGGSGVAKAQPLLQQSVGHGERKRTVRLTHYVPEGARLGQSALLIHGLAHGSRLFWTETVDTPMAQYLLGQGYDVWLLDHSLSVNLHQKPNGKLDIDDIARDDIPWAVLTASAHDQRPLHVFAHCIGAAAFAMATLSGELSRGGRKLVESATLHAMTPWLVGSEDNRLRANLLSLVRDSINDDFDPVPHRDPNRLDTFYDALASSFSWGKDRFRHHCYEQGDSFSRTVCNRMTLFYGQEWGHQNIDRRTHERFHSIVGPASPQILHQGYFCVERGRLTDHEGKNRYVQAANFDEHWTFRTLFLHGDHNKVFNVESTRRSAAELTALHQAQGYLAQRPVSAVVCPGYGHMDIIVGKNAHANVFPHVERFFRGLNASVGQTAALPVTEPAADTQPVVGPIISRPVNARGQRSLRVWMATSDLAAFKPLQVRLGGQELKEKRARPDRGSAASSEFHLGNIEIEPEAPGRAVEVRYPSLGRPAQTDFVPVVGGAFAERAPKALRWKTLPWFKKAFTNQVPTGLVSFAVGSCLYPGFSPEQRLSDSVFWRMRALVRGRGGRGLDHVLLLGDQIYADATGEVFPPRSSLERLRNRYRRAFGGPTAELGRHANWIFSHVPTYFAIDDHEIANDWSRSGSDEFSAAEKSALDEAYNFQMHQGVSHSARSGAFWYHFDSAGFSCFVLDTRSERRSSLSRELAEALLSQEQQRAFATWVKSKQGRGKPLFVASGSALVPLSKDVAADPELAARSDGLIGFPGFQRWLHGVLSDVTSPIVWLAGDLHCSTICNVKLTIGTKCVRWLQVCASGLFAPLPFANTPLQSFATDGPVRFQRGKIRIEATHQLLIKEAQGSFVQVVASDQHVVLRALAARGTARAPFAWALLRPASTPCEQPFTDDIHVIRDPEPRGPSGAPLRAGAQS